MGCAQSNSGEQPQEAAPTRLATPSVHEREGRQRNALRRTNSARARRYAGSGSDRESMPGSARGGGASNSASVHETMLNSDVGASNIVMSQRSSFRSGFGILSPRLAATGPNASATPRTATPRSGAGRPPLPPVPAGRVADRRPSVGRFSDEPSRAELLARIAAVVEKARVANGIDGSVSVPTAREDRENARLAESFLGWHGRARIAAWVDDLHGARLEATAPNTSGSVTPGAGEGLGWKGDMDFVGSPDTTPLPHTVLSGDADAAGGGVQLLCDTREGASTDEDDAVVVLHGRSLGPTKTRLTEENLRLVQSRLGPLGANPVTVTPRVGG